ncbi:MAG: phosphate uptake regulator PhoU [Phycisphaerales bacterium JB038]
MFKQLLSALAASRQIDADFDKIDQMLDNGRWMFEQAVRVLQRDAEPAEVEPALYEKDIDINKLERSIRSDLVRHLSVNPGHDVAAALTLISIAKDAERIGDYCKGVFEVGRFYTEPFRVEAYHEPLEQLHAEVAALFDSVRQVLQTSDKKQAREIFQEIDGIKRRCDEINTRLLAESAQLTTNEGVAYSLLARHFKRVAGHLGNICTALFSDVKHFGYLPKKDRKRLLEAAAAELAGEGAADEDAAEEMR